MRLTILIAITIALTFVQCRAAPTEMAIEMVKHHEGLSLKPYKDTRGNLTVGYGTNLDYIDEEMAEFMLHYVLNRNDIYLGLTYDWYNELDYIPRSIVQDMVYNMGRGGFSKFRKMHYQLARGNWVKAAIEMKSSLWYRQTKLRGDYLYKLMLNYKE